VKLFILPSARPSVSPRSGNQLNGGGEPELPLPTAHCWVYLVMLTVEWALVVSGVQIYLQVSAFTVSGRAATNK